MKNTGLANLRDEGNTYFQAANTTRDQKNSGSINKKKEAAQKATREASMIKVENPSLITSSPLSIPNPQHQLVQLTLNPLLNQSVVDFKISDLKVESPTKLSFTLESSDIKRLINAPIEIAKASDSSTEEEKSQLETNQQPISNIVKIKPKLVLQGAIGVPWTTIKKPAKFSVFLKENDKYWEDLFNKLAHWEPNKNLLNKTKPNGNKNVNPILINQNWHGTLQNNNDPLFRLLEKDPAENLSALSLKVFDPSGYLNQRLAKEGQEGKIPTPTTNLNLYSYQLNKTKE
ncbi:hypothetical protein R7X53_03705, partial [Mesomycoplasma ovipneumoniae]|nr:hypothetical protein [Mesomycoplasma ovipneumoniae]